MNKLKGGQSSNLVGRSCFSVIDKNERLNYHLFSVSPIFSDEKFERTKRFAVATRSHRFQFFQTGDDFNLWINLYPTDNSIHPFAYDWL